MEEGRDIWVETEGDSGWITLVSEEGHFNEQRNPPPLETFTHIKSGCISSLWLL